MTSIKEALEGLIEAVKRDADLPGGRGISGYISARLSDAAAALAQLDSADARSAPWRYEVQHGPDGEANYAWVYDEANNLICIAKTHHAKAIVDRLSTGLLPDAKESEPEYLYDDERFNKGVQHVVDMLARGLDVSDWVAGDGSEDYDCDLWQTILNILAAKGLYNADEGMFVSDFVVPDAKCGLEAAARWHEAEAASAKAIYSHMDRYSDDHEERTGWRSYKDKEDRHLYAARAIRSLPVLPDASPGNGAEKASQKCGRDAPLPAKARVSVKRIDNLGQNRWVGMINGNPVCQCARRETALRIAQEKAADQVTEGDGEPRPSEAIPADVLAMKEACKRAVRSAPSLDENGYIAEKSTILAAIDKLPPEEVKAEGGRGEPVAWLRTWPDGAFSFSQTEPALTKWTTVLPLYTHPASPPDVEAIARIIDPEAFEKWDDAQGSWRKDEAKVACWPAEEKADAIAALIAGGR